MKAELLEGADVFRLAPLLAPAAEAALFIPEHALRVGARPGARAGHAPARPTASCIAAARASRGSRVKAIIGLSVHTDSEAFAADIVVMAAGSWSGQIDSERRRQRGHRTRGQLVADSESKRWRCARRPRASGARATAASRVEGPRRSRTCRGARAATWCRGPTARCSSARPSKKRDSPKMSRSRASTRCSMPPRARAATRCPPRSRKRASACVRRRSDTVPIIGPSPEMPGLFYATGHYRNGILLAPLTAT